MRRWVAKRVPQSAPNLECHCGHSRNWHRQRNYAYHECIVGDCSCVQYWKRSERVDK